MGAFETIIYEKRDGVAWIGLNRPEALNAFNVRMRDDLHEVLSAVRDDWEVRVGVIYGVGSRAFCAGADLSEFLRAPSPMFARLIRWQRDVWNLLLTTPQPLIAALHGYVLGSGLEIALCCDVRLAADDTRFGLPEVGLGFIPAAGGTQTLPRTIGLAASLDMLLTGHWVGAEQAWGLRLVNRVVPPEVLTETVEGMARTIVSRDPRTVRAVKQAVRRGLELSLGQGLDLERRLAEGVAAQQDGERYEYH